MEVVGSVFRCWVHGAANLAKVQGIQSIVRRFDCVGFLSSHSHECIEFNI